MSIETRKLEFGADHHPDENHLLLALERELSPAETAAVERHIGTCWDCRARYHEMHRGILTFVEYRDKVYLPELEPTPRDFGQFPRLLNEIASAGYKAGLVDRIRARLRAFFRFNQISVQTKWVTATAAAMAAVLLWTQILNPPTLSANELLTKADRAQNPPAMHREVRQKVRIKTEKAEFVREFRWETGRPISNAVWGGDPENWSAPLTAQGFAEWRNSLSSGYQDSVKKTGDQWTLKTTAAGWIQEASIVIRASDLHPTEQHIRFSDNRELDLEEVSFDMTETPVPAGTVPATSPAESPATTPSLETPGTPTVNLDEAELELRYAMFTGQLDKDEDLRIERAPDVVVLTGVVSSADRFRQMQAMLAGLRGVRLAFAAPDSAAKSTAAGPSQKMPAISAVPLLRDRLEAAFASIQARRDFVDSCLSVSDTTLSHAWALKRLAERYTDSDRSLLKPELQVKLDEMLRGHLQQLGAANTALNGLVELLPPSPPHRAERPADWHSGILSLFDLVQQQDSLVAALVAGTQNSWSTAGASDRFVFVHESVARLAAELRFPEAGTAVK